MGHFQTEIGSFVCTKRQTCLSRLRICKNIGHFRSGSAPIGLKRESRFRVFMEPSRISLLVINTNSRFFENCATLGTDLGPFQTESGYLVYTKRQICLSRLRICKNIGHFRSGSAPIGLKAKAGFGAKSNFASSYQYKLSFLKLRNFGNRFGTLPDRKWLFGLHQKIDLSLQITNM